MVSAALEGRLIIWDVITANKLKVIALESLWVMSCAIAPSANIVASGGLDNICSIFKMEDEVPIRAASELIGHTGFISCCKFLGESKIITSSADKSANLWDIQTNTKIKTFKGHEKDVMSISIHPFDENLFISGGADCQAKLWDTRTENYVQSFDDNQADINWVTFFPNGNLFGTAAEDSYCRLFDLRADRELTNFSKPGNPNEPNPCTSVAFSLSGKYTFTAYEDSTVGVWDTLRGEKIYQLNGHGARVSCLEISPDAMALCTGSWDNNLKVWA